MKWIYLIMPLLCFVKSFGAVSPTSPEGGRQAYNIINIKNSEKETPREEVNDLENL